MSKKKKPRFEGRLAQRQVKKKRRRKLFTWLFLFPLIIVGLGAAVWGTYIYIKADNLISDSYENIGRERSEHRKKDINPKEDNISVLILGVDENEHRENFGSSRTDTMILATLNKEEKSIKLLSIPRDSYVYIPQLEMFDKINHAHYFGGVDEGIKYAIDTVEHLFDGIPVDYFVKLNFHSFIEIIDALGGVTVDVPYEFKESDSMDRRDTIHLYPGVQELNGEEALAFARTRKHDNDIARGERQLEIIKAIISKSASFSSILKYGDVLDAIDGHMSTNVKNLGDFASYASTVKNFNVETYSLEGEDYWLDGIYYWSIDEQHLDEMKTILREHLGLDTPDDETDNPNEWENEEQSEYEEGGYQEQEGNHGSQTEQYQENDGFSYAS